MQFRLATAGDLKQCVALDSSYETDHVWQMQSQVNGERIDVAFFPARLPRSITVTMPIEAKWLRQHWDRHEFFLIAEHQGRVLAFVDMTLEPWQQAGWINNLVVEREVRRRGLGTALMKAARLWAEQQGLRVLMLETQPKNHPAIQLYQQLGFRFCGFNDQFYSNDDVAFFFACRLR